MQANRPGTSGWCKVSAEECGDAFYWAAGHAPEAITDCEYARLLSTESIKPVLEHITGGGG